MKLSDIRRAVAARVDDATGLVPVIHDRKGDGHYKSNGQPYAKVSIAPLDNREPVYCDSVMRSGYILANVYAQNGYGATGATMEAEKFADLFPEELEFAGITIPDEPNIREASDGPVGWFYVSTVIYFEAR